MMVKEYCCVATLWWIPKEPGSEPEQRLMRAEIRVTFLKDPGIAVLSRRTLLADLVLLGGFIGSAWLAKEFY